jgi:DNA repair exonuclease SbcCD ATPase subunit
MKNKINDLINKLQQQKWRKIELEKNIEQLHRNFAVNIDTLDVIRQVSLFIQEVSVILREQFINKVEKNVTKVLQQVLDNKNIEFKMLLNTNGARVVTEFKTFNKSTGCEFNIVKGEAGGIKNIISTALLITFLELFPEIEGPLILDEVGKNISQEYQESFGKFLREYAETGRQVILVSHIKGINKYAHNIINLNDYV